MWRSIKIAEKQTYSQWLETANKLREEHGESTEHVLDLPDDPSSESDNPSKYSLHQLKSRGDYHVEGGLMENCINLDSSYNRAGDLHSIRDENNFPVVSMRMRRRTNDDWSERSDATSNRDMTRNPESHHTGNDVLVVDEAVQRGNAEITKYIRPALSAMVEYAKKNNIPKIVFRNGANQAGYGFNPVPVADVENLLNNQEETPDYLHVSYLKGLRREDGSLPTKVSLVPSAEGIESGLSPILVHEKPISDEKNMLIKDGDDRYKMGLNDFYDTVRVPFSKKRFERQGGLKEEAESLFSATPKEKRAGWQLRDHVEELPRTVLNDVVGKATREPKLFSGAVQLNSRLGTINIGDNAINTRTLRHFNESQGFAEVKPDKIHPTMPSVPMRNEGYYMDDEGRRQWGTYYTLGHSPALVGDITKNSLQPSVKKLYVSTPSSLRDNPMLFDREGINSRFLYSTTASLSPNRSHFVGTNKNDIWEIDASKLSADQLGYLTRDYNRNGKYTEIQGIIPYEALSMSSQSEMNKRKALPDIVKQCKTCGTPWADEHEGHDSKLVNDHPAHKTVPDNFEIPLPRNLTIDAVESLRRGEIHPDVVRKVRENLNEGVGAQTPVVTEPSVRVAYDPDKFIDVTGTQRWYKPDRFADYASGANMPTSRTYKLRTLPDQEGMAQEIPIDAELKNVPEIPAMPKKLYFGIDSQRRRDENTYGERGIDTGQINRYSSQSMDMREQDEHIPATHDVWSMDISHPSVRDRVRFDRSANKWHVLQQDDEQKIFPYSALKLERRADQQLSPHVRQFFSKVAAYLNRNPRLAQYLTDGETSGGWVSEYWGQSGSVSAPTTADPSEAEVDPATGKRKRPNGSLWTTIGDNGIDNPEYIRQLNEDPKFKNILKGWQSLKNLFSPNTPGINTYSSVIRIVEAASRRQERLEQRQNAIDWVSNNSVSSRQYEPAAETVHEFPNGFTVKKLKTYGDLGFEGQMMNHCLKEDFKSECETCGGSGRCENYCEDGYSECPTCDGDGTQNCDTCGGDGEVYCSACDGEGTIENDEGETDDCAPCEGLGKVSCEEEDCKVGKVNCEDCYGDKQVGKISCDGYNCASGFCNECEGNGGTSRDANEEFEPDELNRASNQPYSLRNADDVPVVTWWENDDDAVHSLSYPKPRIESVYGRRDEKPKPEYQHLLLQYIKDKKFGEAAGTEVEPVSVEWGRAGTISYTPETIDKALSGTAEKPTSLYFNHDHYPCTLDAQHDKSCIEQEGFTSRIQPVDYALAWERHSEFERYRETMNKRGQEITDPNPVYRVDVKDINPQHLIYVPSDESWQINPRKMKDQPRDIFKHVATKEDFDPSAYTQLTTTSAWRSVVSNSRLGWKSISALWNPNSIEQINNYGCERCKDTKFVPTSSVDVVEWQTTPNIGKWIDCSACGGSGGDCEGALFSGGSQPCKDGKMAVHACPNCYGEAKAAAIWNPSEVEAMPGLGSSVTRQCPDCQYNEWDLMDHRIQCGAAQQPCPDCLSGDDVESTETVECGTCSGEKTEECDSCYGSGSWPCDDPDCVEYEHDCDECDNGRIDCLDCHGKGYNYLHRKCDTCNNKGVL